MKKIFSTLCALAALSLTSCSDYLDVIPLNEVVEENYWTEKADVISLLNSCYAQMESKDVMQRMFVWGELRSDNVVLHTSAPHDLRQIGLENILETNGMLSYESLYQAINRCNTVIHYAPIVAAKDPNYALSEVNANIAEATFLRSLAYFYLCRTFKDVPYTTKPSNTDADIANDYCLPPLPFDQMIDQLISDLEAVLPFALRIYPEASRTVYTVNTSRVGVCAFYALLADLYLWKGEYAKCAAYCDRVFEYKLERYEELKDEDPNQALRFTLWHNKYPLVMEQPSGNSQGSAYNALFGEGNSLESVFELYFQENQPTKNEMITEYFGSSSQPVGQCLAHENLYANVYEKTNELFKPSDCRVPEFLTVQQTQYCIRKYAYQRTSFTLPKTGNIDAPRNPGTMRSSAFANWIIYRLTDVMLMKAEADVEMDTPASLADAFQLVSTVYNRANNYDVTPGDTLDFAKYATKQQMRELVMDERRRELLFEGKRWFDLVRYTLRAEKEDPATYMTYLINTVLVKQKDRQAAIRAQLEKEGSLFWPYLKRELDINPNLVQNPAYDKNKGFAK